MGDAMNDRSGLARSGTGDAQEWIIAVANSLSLFFVQPT
jgi:hypothetical protein